MKIDNETLEALERYCNDDAYNHATLNELGKLTKFVDWTYDYTNKELVQLSLRPYLSIRKWSDDMIFYTSYKKDFGGFQNDLEKLVNETTDKFIEANGGYRNINIKKYILFKIEQMKKVKQALDVAKFKTMIEE